MSQPCTNITFKFSIIGNHTFAGLKADESYENLSGGFGDVMAQLNSLIDNPVIEVNETKYTLEFFLGGDYKVKADK